MHFPHHHLSLSVNSVLKNYSLANNHVCNFAKPSLLFAKTYKEPLFDPERAEEYCYHSNMKAKVAATAEREREKRGGKLEKKDLNSVRFYW